MLKQQVAIVMSEVFLRRLTPSLMPFVRRRLDFRIISIHRPVDELTDILTKQPTDGLITEWLPEKTDALIGIGLPSVIVDTDSVYPNTSSIDVDDWAVGQEAAEAFLRAGFKSVACLTNGTPYSAQRLEGFRNAVGADRFVGSYEVTAFANARYTEQFVGPNKALNDWLIKLPKPVGIFAVHDPLGRYLSTVCEGLDLRVPDKVAIIGANNDELVCGLSYPMLSSVEIPWHQIGTAAGEEITRRLAGQPSPKRPHLIAPGTVTFRHSASDLAVSNPLLRRAMTYFHNHLNEPISISELCREIACARRTLERSFQEFYQTTPWDMLCRLRVKRAKQHLIQTNHSIAMISDLCGFNDPERMAVVFKRIEGAPPSKFRPK